MELGSWARLVPPSGIREIVNLVLARPEAGIIRLEVGEPDLPIEPHIVAAAQEAAALGIGYTQSFGIAALREAIVERLQPGGRTVLRRRRDRRRPGWGAGDGCHVRRPPRRRRRGAAARSGVAELRDDGGVARCRRRSLRPAGVERLPARRRPAAPPDHRSHPADRDQQPGQPHGCRVPRRAGGIDRRTRCRARPVGPVRRGVRRARLRGDDGQRRAVRPRTRHRHLQLLQDLLDDRLEGRLRGVPAIAGGAARHAPGTDGVVHLRGQPARRPGGVARPSRWRRPQARGLPSAA